MSPGRILCVCFCNESMPSFKQEVFVFTANSQDCHHGCRGAKSFSKFLFSPYVIQPLKTSSWQWLLKRTPSATHPPGPSNWASVIPSIPGVQHGWHSRSCTKPSIQPPHPYVCSIPAGHSLQLQDYLFGLYWDFCLVLELLAGFLFLNYLLLTKHYTQHSHLHRKWWKTDCFCARSSLSRKEPYLQKGMSGLHIYYHTTKGRQYICDLLWLPSKVAGISLS